MTIPVEQLQNLNGYSIIELFQIDLVSGTHYSATDTSPTTYYRFHNGTNEINTSIVWAGETYRPIACQAEGFEFGDNTTMARPTLTFSNVVGTFSTILEIVNQITAFNDLQTATVKRRRTLAQFLDDANFSGNNPYGSPNPQMELEQQEFLINKKIVENNQICSFELVNTIDFEELQLPKLQITKDRFPAVGSFVFE
tara:strand:- start:6738 stop:7328 length:591 start_codon:yes stop_codon:yes gene_type:complete